MLVRILFICLLIGLSGAPAGAADGPAGSFTRVAGRVDITAPGSAARPAAEGDPIHVGEIIRTKSQSRAELTFTDGNVVRLAAGSRLEITTYMISEEKTEGSFHLFRGKIQSIVQAGIGLFGGGRSQDVKVRTRTAICGVRGTDFFTYYLNGISGAVFREGTGYGYALDQPDQIMEIGAGMAMVVADPTRAPVIRPATPAEMQQHLQDTAPEGGESDRETGGTVQAQQDTAAETTAPEGTAAAAETETVRVEQVIADAIRSREQIDPADFEFQIDIEEIRADADFYYSLGIDAEGNAGINIPFQDAFVSLISDIGIRPEELPSHIYQDWQLYIGNRPGYFEDGASTGGSIFVSPIFAESTYLEGSRIGVGSIAYTGTYLPFNDHTFDTWHLNLDYHSGADRHLYAYTGTRWSEGKVAANGVSAWVNLSDLVSGIGAGGLEGSYDPGSGTWQAAGRWATLDTGLFLTMAQGRAPELEALGIPGVEIGRASLAGSGNNLSVAMNDVTFFSYSTGAAPRIWATSDIQGGYTGTPRTGQAVALNGDGLSADFTLNTWQSGRWGADIDSGQGTLMRTDTGQPQAVQFSGAAVGQYGLEAAGAGRFSGTGAGLAGN